MENKRAALEQHAPTLADVHRLFLVLIERGIAEHGDVALIGHLQADDRSHQHRFAGARSAHHAENLAAPHIEIKVVVHDLILEAVAQPLHPDDEIVAFALLRHGQFHPIQVKNTAKKASRTITRKIACTTADVVLSPTCSASDSTSIPWKQPAIAMIAPNTGALTSPT